LSDKFRSGVRSPKSYDKYSTDDISVKEPFQGPRTSAPIQLDNQKLPKLARDHRDALIGHAADFESAVPGPWSCRAASLEVRTEGVFSARPAGSRLRGASSCSRPLLRARE